MPVLRQAGFERLRIGKDVLFHGFALDDRQCVFVRVGDRRDLGPGLVAALGDDDGADAPVVVHHLPADGQRGALVVSDDLEPARYRAGALVEDVLVGDTVSFNDLPRAVGEEGVGVELLVHHRGGTDQEEVRHPGEQRRILQPGEIFERCLGGGRCRDQQRRHEERDSSSHRTSRTNQATRPELPDSITRHLVLRRSAGLTFQPLISRLPRDTMHAAR